MKDENIRRLVISALLAALVCVSTMLLPVPSPTGGYVNAGDGFVLLAGWLLGPWYGAAAAGIGSALTDLLMGYAAYAPASLLIKGGTALLASLLFRSMRGHHWALAVSGIIGELWMAAGYFLFTALLLGRGLGALLSVPGNLVQGAVGVVVGTTMMHVVRKCHLPEKI